MGIRNEEIIQGHSVSQEVQYIVKDKVLYGKER
jgi:hypothetical protein